MAVLKFQGELEVDTARGVVYFTNEDTGWLLLRISGIPTDNMDLLENRDTAAIDVRADAKHSGVAPKE